MSKNLLSRYIWLVDTIRKEGPITREELNRRWRNSPFFNGEDLPRRTFYNYRNAIEELFNVNIDCNPSTYEYFISHSGARQEEMADWLLYSAVSNSVMAEARDLASRIFIDDVPSAREHLSTVMEAMRECLPLSFNYSPYSRPQQSDGVVVEPYFLKIFRNRWYITGRNPDLDAIRTYSLDRMTRVEKLATPFKMPKKFDAEEFSRDSFGVIFNDSPASTVRLRTDPRKAKYLRALPLHHSQTEIVHDDYSIFSYSLRITPDLVAEILSHGPSVQVLEPKELRSQVECALEATLAAYRREDEARMELMARIDAREGMSADNPRSANEVI